jgi:ketosteroid isomerase-like protein
MKSEEPSGVKRKASGVVPSRLTLAILVLLCCCTRPSPPTHLEQRAQLWISTLNSHNVEALAELFGTNGRYEAPMNFSRPLTGNPLRTYWSGLWRDFPNLVFVAKAVMVQGDRAALEWEAKGTHVSGGQPLSLSGVSVIEFRGDQVARVRDYYDATAFLPFLSPKKPQ